MEFVAAVVGAARAQRPLFGESPLPVADMQAALSKGGFQRQQPGHSVAPAIAGSCRQRGGRRERGSGWRTRTKNRNPVPAQWRPKRGWKPHAIVTEVSYEL